MKKILFVVALVLVFSTSSYASNSALEFDGSGTLLIPDSNNWYFGTDDFTIDFWIKFKSTGHYGIMEQYTVAEDSWWILDGYGAPYNYLRFKYKSNSPSAEFQIASFGFPITTDTWQHLALVRNSDNWSVYRDGVSLPLTLLEGNYSDTFPDCPGPLIVGRTLASGESFNGCLDEIRIWDEGMTQEQVQYWMQYAPMGSESSLKAYWNFNEGSGGIAYDTTIYGTHGNINGATWCSEGVDLPTVPEPATMLLFGLGAIGAGLFRTRRKQ